jgi:predicted secreted protein
MDDHAVTSEPVTVSVGAEFAVYLKSTPTTGYVWEVQSLPESIRLLGSDYERPADDARPGDSMTQAFRFQALTAGEHAITFVLKRQWEREAIEYHTVKIEAD